MFLQITRERNPRLIEAGLALHREGIIPPNCFVLDLDAVAANASQLAEAARRAGLSLYFTTKQIGFNPLVARRVVEAGIPKALAIDTREAVMLAQNGVPIGHVGHLVQLPARSIAPVLRLEPEVVTVFSVAKAEQISAVASQLGRRVGLLLRVVAKHDFLYPGQAGGIRLERLPAEATAIRDLPHVWIAGVTSYPCVELDEASGTLSPTSNFATILAAAAFLRDDLGVLPLQINAPGNTCAAAMELLAQMGATHGEPGHALTGTTYLHARSLQPEVPALVYVSEVSHLSSGLAYAFGGGTYRRAQTHNALVGCLPDQLAQTHVLPLDPKAIDYYIALARPRGQQVRVGDTVVIASRAQVFVSRSYLAVVAGIQSGQPSLSGLYDPWGRPAEGMVERE